MSSKGKNGAMEKTGQSPTKFCLLSSSESFRKPKKSHQTTKTKILFYSFVRRSNFAHFFMPRHNFDFFSLYLYDLFSFALTFAWAVFHQKNKKDVYLTSWASSEPLNTMNAFSPVDAKTRIFLILYPCLPLPFSFSFRFFYQCCHVGLVLFSRKKTHLSVEFLLFISWIPSFHQLTPSFQSCKLK